MLIQVNPHKIVLIKTNDVNSGEYNVNECTFEFSQEFDNLTCIAVFSLCDGTTKNITILNNRCIIPTEVLTQTGQVKIGVYGYSVQDDELVLRYSPTPQIFVVTEGSYKEGTEPVAPTPTDWEILVQQVSDNSRDISDIKEDITGINGEISGINIDIRDLQDTKANINDLSAVAFSGSYNDLINKPNLSVYATKTDLSDEATLRENADVALQEQIDAINVSSDVVDVVGTYQELLDYDTQHLKDNDIVKVLVDSTHNDALSYYRWDKEPQTWSYIGSEGPFYTKAETRELLNAKEDKITTTNKLDADLVDDSNSTNKFVTEEDITYWDNKEDKSNKVTEINSSSTDTQYPSAKCVYDSQEEQNKHIAELEMLYNAFPTVSAENETIQLDNTAKVKFREIDLKGNTSQVVIPEEQGTSVSNTSIYVSDVDTDKENTIEMSGNTYQETTTGANLMPVVNVTKTTGGVEITNNGDGTLTLNGTATAQVVYPITNTGNNTLRIVPVTENDYKFMLYGDTNVSNDTYFLQVLFGTETETTKFFAATDNGATSLHIETDRSIGYALIIRNGQSFNNHIIKPMGVLSTYTGGFEPYTYGASPNPSYPQNIEVVTGTQNVEVCGKNFIPTNINNWESGQYNVSGTKQDMASRIRLKELLPIKPNTTYYFDIFDTTEFSLIHNFIIRECDKNGSVINSIGIVNNQSTYTSNNNAYYLMVTIGTSSTASGETFENYQTYFSNGKLKPFICLNSTTDKSYEAYQGTTYPINLGNIELCRLNVDNTIYKDRIYQLNNKWYLEKNISKVILNGSEGNWFRASTNTNTLRFNNENAITNGYAISAIKIISNKFINGSDTGDNGDYEHIRSGVIDYPNSLSIIIDKTRLPGNTANNFTTWLSNNNVTVYYLATPTTTEITDTTLVNQLNALYNATIYPITNINTDTSNLLPYIDLHYNFVTPSPSPSRPSVVNVVKGNNTITISNSDNTESQNYPINLGDMELCKINTYQDYIYESNGNWFKKSNIDKVVLNGSERWIRSGNTSERLFCGALAGVNLPFQAKMGTASKTNYFVKGNKNSNAEVFDMYNGTDYYTTFALYLSTSRATDITTFKTWLSTHNTIVYYVLETPTDTQITDTTLITQLNNIKKAYSYDTQTNISQTNTDKPFIIYAEAIRSLKDVFE